MSRADVANTLVALMRSGQFHESGETCWAENVVSIEPGGPPGMDAVSRGKAAVKAKGQWWADNPETQQVEVEGPSQNGDPFTCRFTMTAKVKATGHVMDMDEHALYTVRDGKIVEETFFQGS